MTIRWPAILLFGPPGSGKGTQAKFLSALAPLLHLSTGDIFRSIPKQSELGKQLASFSSRGALVPDQVTLEIWHDYVQGLVQTFRFDPLSQWLLLDGLPRTKEQASLIADHVDVKLILNLQVAEPQTLIKRLSQRALIEGRADDAKSEVVAERLQVYQKQTSEVLHSYPESIQVTIQADLPPLLVLHEILPHLQKLLAN